MVTAYAESMKLEYTRIAELKTIDIRRDARDCDFE